MSDFTADDMVEAFFSADGAGAYSGPFSCSGSTSRAR